MKRALVVNGILAAVALALVALLWWPGNDAHRHRPRLPTVTDLAAGQIDQLRVRRGADLVQCRRRDQDWRLESPAHAPADAAHLDVLVALAVARPTRRLKDVPGDDVTGLGPNAVVVRYNQGAPIRIGAPGPRPGSYYVETSRGVFLVAIPHFDALHWRWTDWLDRALVPPDKQLARLVLPDFTLSDATGHWQAAPAGKRSAAAAAATIAAWQNAKALTIEPADRTRDRIARITLYFRHADASAALAGAKNENRRVFDVIEDKPNLILRDEALGVDYHLAGNRVPPLLELIHPTL